jgi:hypothetical protein
MSIHELLMKARQDDARRAGERGRLLLEARRASLTRRGRTGPITPVKRMPGLLLHRVAPGSRQSAPNPSLKVTASDPVTLPGDRALTNAWVKAPASSPPMIQAYRD